MIEKNQKTLFQWGGPGIILLVFFGLTIWTWRKWPDILIDYGRELYIPWQLCAGKVLYKDIDYFMGPLAPYLNAILFRIFGISNTTLIFSSLVLTILITLIIYLLVKNCCDRLTAILASIVFLCCFAFPLYKPLSIFNYICPYDYNMIYGIFLAILTIYLLFRYMNDPQLLYIIPAGICLGLVFLTKFEIYLATAISLITGLVLKRKTEHVYSNISIILFFLVVFMMIPIIIFTLYFYSKMPLAQSISGVFTNLSTSFSGRTRTILYIKHLMGMDRPYVNSISMLISFSIITLITFMIAFIDIKKVLADKFKKLTVITLLLLFLLFCLFTSMEILTSEYPLEIQSFSKIIGRSLPLLSLSSILLIIIFFRRLSNYQRNINCHIELIIWSIFSLILLGRILLKPTIRNYGFVLAMPAMVGVVILYVWIMPRLLHNYFGTGNFFRKIAIIGVIIFSILCVIQSAFNYKRKNYKISNGTDEFITFNPQFDPRVLAIAQLLDHIKTSVAPDENFVVFPEGVIINYLARRPSPIPYIVFNPGELTIYQEDAVLKSLKEHPPHYIILVHRPTKEDYKTDFFGTDPNYGAKIMEWVNQKYILALQILDEPLKNEKFGIKLLKRK